ncbi:MAG: M3 family metallopeptidase [Legionellaceae bacterium]
MDKLPLFSKISIQEAPHHLALMLQNNKSNCEALVKKKGPFTYDNLIAPLDDMDDALSQFWAPIAHLHAVCDTKALRACFESCLPQLSAYDSYRGHHGALYNAIKSIDSSRLNPTQQKIIDDTLRDFKLSGIGLSTTDKHRFEAIDARLSTLSHQFENNILDAEQQYELHILDENRLNGLPSHAREAAQARAKEKKLDGFILNLEFPCYLAVMTYADDRALRETLYTAYVTRASDLSPDKAHDNTAIMDEILALRHEKALLLGFKHYAQYSLATKMAPSTEAVFNFLESLIQKTRDRAKQEFMDLETFAGQSLQPFDIAYYSQKKKQTLTTFSDEELRPYFPLPHVLKGLFYIIHALYNVHIEAIPESVDVWHPDVHCYRITDEHQTPIGYLYMDLFARPHKRGGAWMDSAVSRRKKPDGELQLPVAFLTCNFAKSEGEHPASLTHDELITLFHECGHCLQHLLTKVDDLGASGIQGVEWDAVELPSQFFENWCWDKKALQHLSSHVETGQPLPDVLFERLLASKQFQSAMSIARQLEFASFDFLMHASYAPEQPHHIAQVLNKVRSKIAVVPIAPYNRAQHSFAHVFSGGYAAGYYSYLWAEVLSSDAFARFEEEGIFNPQTGQDFLCCILEVGGSCKAETAFEAFRGRPAKIDAFLKHHGIV